MERGSVIKFSFSATDVFNNTKIFRDHRDYVRYRFAKMGYEVTQWNWDMDPETGRWEQYKDGVGFKKNDSDIELSIEVSGVVGLNLKELRKKDDNG